MATKEANFRNWIRFFPCRPGFVNSHWWALLRVNIGQCCQSEDNFKVPIFMIEDGLEKEESDKTNSVPPFSAVIREFLIHLLRLALAEANISYANYNEVLRRFLDKEILLKNPLSRNGNFHELSPEIKLYIFSVILQYSPRVVRRLTPFGVDSDGNGYFLVDGGLLYLQPGPRLDALEKSQCEREEEAMHSVEAHFRQRPQWKLLADTREEWTMVETCLRSFNQFSIAAEIGKRIDEAMKMKITKEEHLEQRLSFMKAAPPALLAEKRKSRTVLSKPRTNGDEEESAFNLREMHRTLYSDDSPPPIPNPSESEPRSVETTNRRLKSFRCMHFPQCPRSDEDCHFIHPVKTCRNFPKQSCPGVYCFFLHPDCPNDGNCKNDNCAYEHRKSKPTLLRRNNADNEERPSRSRNSHSTSRNRSSSRTILIVMDDPMGRESNRSRSVRRVRFVSESDSATSSQVNIPPGGKESRTCCYFFPRCKRKDCTFWHRTVQCKLFPNCSGMSCLFLHGPCPQDGICENEWCPYEHYQQTPPRAAAIFKRANENKQASNRTKENSWVTNNRETTRRY